MEKAIYCFFAPNCSTRPCFMASTVNIDYMNSIPKIFLLVLTTLPISIYTPSLIIYLSNYQIYLKNLVKKAFWVALISDFWPKSARNENFYYIDPLQYTPF